MSLTKILGENKEDIRDVSLPRKNTISAIDYNEIKDVVNDVIDRFVFVSGVAVVPDLVDGQLGINTTDARLFINTDEGVKYIQLIDLP